MDSLEAELAEARALDLDRLADAIEAIGFECTRCGACCKAESCDENTGATEENRGASDGNRSASHGNAGASDGNRGATDGNRGASDGNRGASDGNRGASDGNAGATDRDTGATDGDSAGDAGEAADESAPAEPHTATVFPDEIRRLQAATSERFDEDYDWRDVARPMPYGLAEGPDGRTGETFEWALATDGCGDCTFYEAGGGDHPGACTVHADRPLICRTYPFSLALGGTSQPMGEAVDREGLVRAHECEGLGRDIDREAATDLAAALRERAIRELEEAIAVRDGYETVAAGESGVVVHDSEGAKRADGTPYDRG